MIDYEKDYSKRVGDIVDWNGEKWVVDNTDDNFKDDGEETSLFLIPEKYSDEKELDELYRTGNPDKVGYWVKASEVYCKEENV